MIPGVTLIGLRTKNAGDAAALSRAQRVGYLRGQSGRDCRAK